MFCKSFFNPILEFLFLWALSDRSDRVLFRLSACSSDDLFLRTKFSCGVSKFLFGSIDFSILIAWTEPDKTLLESIFNVDWEVVCKKISFYCCWWLEEALSVSLFWEFETFFASWEEWFPFSRVSTSTSPSWELYFRLGVVTWTLTDFKLQFLLISY